MSFASAALVTALAAAPLADVWPYEGKRLPSGEVEYAYDLTPVKAGQGTPDARLAHGEDKVKAFISGLPRQVKVRVAPGGRLRVRAASELEAAPLSPSFGAVREGKFLSSNPLDQGPGARVRPPLHADSPKELLGVDAVVWWARHIEDGAVAAVALEDERLHQQVWSQVQKLALKRFKDSQGDIREGSLELVARLAAAEACLDRKRVPASLLADAEVATAVDAELSRFGQEADILAAPGPFAWTPKLTCAWVRLTVLGRPFPRTRAGIAAALLFLETMKDDAALKARVVTLRQRRDALLGAPDSDPISQWEAKAQASRYLDAMDEFFESIPPDEREPPPLLGAPSWPALSFLRRLEGRERNDAFDELVVAVSDGRVASGLDPAAPWPVLRAAGLAPLVTADQAEQVTFDGDWRDHLTHTFAAVQGATRESAQGRERAELEPPERAALTVRLHAPPLLHVEPVPRVYQGLAASLRALVKALEAAKLGSLKRVLPSGRSAGAVVAEAKSLAVVLDGLAALSTQGPASDAKVEAAAQRFARAWRTQLRDDVRQASALPVSTGGDRRHAAVVGVGRQVLGVVFDEAPAARVVGEGAFTVETDSEQRYLVPVLVSVGAKAKASAPPLDTQLLRRAVDGAQRDKPKLEGAFIEALDAAQKK